MKEEKNKVKFLFLLVALLGFHLVNNYLWLKADKVLLADDPFWYHLRSVCAYLLMKNGYFFVNPLQSLLSVIEISKRSGLFVQLVTAPFYFISGMGQDQATMVSASIFLPILVFTIYGITKRLSDGKTGILAAFIISMYPIVFNHSRMYMLDLPLTALVSLGMYILVRGNLYLSGLKTAPFKARIIEEAAQVLPQPKYPGLQAGDDGKGLFKKAKNVFLFILVLSFALLIKINFLIFIVTPLLVILARKKQGFKIKTAFILTTIFIVPFFYFLKNKQIYTWLVGLFSLFRFTEVSRLLPSLAEYFLRLIDNGSSFLLALTFVISLVFFIKSKTKEKFLLLSSLFIPFGVLCIFTSFGDPMPVVRYSMPLLIFTAMITAIGLTNMHHPFFRRFVIFSVCTLSLVQFFAVSWGIPWLPETILLRKSYFELALFRQNLHMDPARNRFSQPTRSSWDANPLWDKIINDVNKNNKGKPITVIVIDPLCEVFYPLYYRAVVERRPICVMSIDMTPPRDEVYRRKFALKERVLEADYVIATITPRRNLGAFLYSEGERREAEDLFYRNIQKFDLIAKFNLPDQVDILLYKNLR